MGSSPGILGRKFDAEISVEASEGIGLTQNAYHDQQWKLGKNTMPDVFGRSMQTNDKFEFDFHWAPQLVVVALGGNDFNHQEGHVPSDTRFFGAFESFLLSIFGAY